ncbi:integrase [Streptococcus phage Javan377]|uniref:Site-specific recombinase, phage integrase family n=1 Tax=Streptococcus parasanguinis F0449 TaxID=1095733 RepID=I2NHM0_STRPA|nr:site-specific integrase [Streptococcus parasanguinis]EIG25331.1 site-specific recombinase, phage integrase family [Streptococcus parasanguinis F0449]QBX17797.1 integrase [Streptococcus phage Javan377]QBX17845.1 integrase [Streptococcus phage Javan381]QBX27335.1 integrase [Streptococcus phage Javan380]
MIKKYTTKNGETRYLFQTYLGIDPITGKERRTTRRGFKTIKEAKQAERNLLLDVEENGLPSNQSDGFQDPTFEELASLWLENYKTTVKPSTFENVKSKVEKMTEEHFKELKLKKITVAYCQRVVIELNKNYVLYNHYLSVINRIFKYAVLMDILDSNPFDKVIKPKSRQTQRKGNFLTKEELKEFLKLAQTATLSYFFPLVHLMSYTGLRQGEALALKWSDIDFENKKITVDKTATRIKEKQTLQTPKTKNSKRVISIDPTTLSILKSWKKDQIKIYFKNGKHFEGDDNFIFTNQRAEWVHIHNFIPYFKRFIADHGIKPITPHGLRHTHASLLFSAGVEPKNISDRLGHSTVQITLDLYTHITEEQRSDTVEKLLEYMVI